MLLQDATHAALHTYQVDKHPVRDPMSNQACMLLRFFQ